MLRRWARFTVSTLVKIVYRPQVSGAHHIPATGPCIIAANHLSFSDHVFISLATRRPVVFIGKAERLTGTGLRGRLGAAFFRAIEIVPVDRDGAHRATAALDVAREVLAEGRVFGIHPEGTRSPDGRVHKGRTGVGFLALATGAPVIPCGLTGTDRVQPLGTTVPRVARFAMRFGEPMTFTGPETDPRLRRTVTDQIMREIQRLSGLEYVDRYGNKDKSAPAEPATRIGG